MSEAALSLLPPERLTHRQLVERAARWLRSKMRCNPVFTERGSINCQEMPDAYGLPRAEWVSRPVGGEKYDPRDVAILGGDPSL